MTSRIIVKLKNDAELEKFRSMVHSRKNRKNADCWIERTYSKAEWSSFSAARPRAAYVVGCKTDKAAFKLAMMFESEKYFL